MSFRFRRTLRLLPGVRLNFGKRGVSATIGGRGASINVGRRGTHGNVGLPGTGISYRERLDGSRGSAPGAGSRRLSFLGAVVVGALVILLLSVLLG